jgi:hypothetical protein
MLSYPLEREDLKKLQWQSVNKSQLWISLFSSVVLLPEQLALLLCERLKKLSSALSESLYFSHRLIDEAKIFVISKAKPKILIKKVSEEDPKGTLLEYSADLLLSLKKAKEEYLKLGGLSINEYLERRKAKNSGICS